MRKIGFDIHGVVDKFPDIFTTLGRIFVNAGIEVHIITGSPDGPMIQAELYKAGMIKGVHYTHFFSILDYNESLGNSVQYDKYGYGWCDNDIWNKTKGEYCKNNNIDLMIDDSDEYHKYFDLDKTVYCLVK